jgi:hypothetical protein
MGAALCVRESASREGKQPRRRAEAREGGWSSIMERVEAL